MQSMITFVGKIWIIIILPSITGCWCMEMLPVYLKSWFLPARQLISTAIILLTKREVNKAFSIARYFNLPFLFVRFMANHDRVVIWEESDGQWRTVTYDQLRDIYESYGVVQPGTARKRVNQYTSSPYHDWQRNNLGRITVSDFDLIKYSSGRVQEIIELKRSKIPLKTWKPYPNDYPNFALLINTIVGSGKKIPFTLYYNFMRDGQMGRRTEDTSHIKVFDFLIPGNMISSDQVRYRIRGYYRLHRLLH